MRHRAVAEELTEWWEDVRDGGIGSRVVLVQVPPGWGTSVVLEDFAERMEDPAGPVTIGVHVDDVPLVSRAIQAGAMRDALRAPFERPKGAERSKKVAELLDLDRPAGQAQLGLGIGGLFASALPVAAGLLVGSLAVTAAGNAWDASPAGEQGGLARAARALAAVSVAAPVAVIIDQADRLDLDLATVMIENLASRVDGRVLVVAVAAPGSALAARTWLWRRVRTGIEPVWPSQPAMWCGGAARPAGTGIHRRVRGGRGGPAGRSVRGRQPGRRSRQSMR